MNGRLALGAGMLAGLAFDNVRRAAQAESDHHPLGDMVDLSDGSRLHYVERGSGPPVLLIHGAFMQLEDMGMTLLRPLSERFRTVAVDRPGHGHSTRPFMSGALMTQAAKIRSIVEDK
jgi:pimeloyl-ACP methyl ester carboxylesterase